LALNGHSVTAVEILLLGAKRTITNRPINLDLWSRRIDMRIDTQGTTMLLSLSAVRLRVRYISTQDFAESFQDVAPSE